MVTTSKFKIGEKVYSIDKWLEDIDVQFYTIKEIISTKDGIMYKMENEEKVNEKDLITKEEVMKKMEEYL